MQSPVLVGEGSSLPRELWEQCIFTHITGSTALGVARLVCRYWADQLKLSKVYLTPMKVVESSDMTVLHRLKSLSTTWIVEGAFASEHVVPSDDIWSKLDISSDLGIKSLIFRTLRHRGDLLLKCVSNAPSLKKVEISDADLPVGPELGELLDHCSQLEHLSIDIGYYEQGYYLDFNAPALRLMNSASRHRHLKTLELDISVEAIDAVFDHLSRNVSLQNLSLGIFGSESWDGRTASPGISKFCSNNNHLLSLRLRRPHDRQLLNVLTEMRKNSSIESLDLYPCSGFNADSLASLGFLLSHSSTLKHFTCQDLFKSQTLPLDVETFSAFLQRSSTLQSLHLAYCGIDSSISPSLIAAVSAIPSITSLDLWGNSILQDAVETAFHGSNLFSNLVKNSYGQLEVLRLDATSEVMTEFFVALMEPGNRIMSSLESLHIAFGSDHDQEQRSAAAKALGEYLSSTKSLKSLGVSLPEFDAAFPEFFAGLKSNTSITKLVFSNGQNTPVDDFFATLSQMSSLTDLECLVSPIKDPSHQIVAKFMNATGNLKRLSLEYCQLSTEVLVAISAALCTGGSLRRLRIYGSMIDAVAAEAFAAAMTSGSCCLQELILSKSYLVNQGKSLVPVLTTASISSGIDLIMQR